MIYLYRILGFIGGGLIVAIAVIIVRLILKPRKLTLNDADKWLVDAFSGGNVEVFGKKGTGKDLIFQHVIALRGAKHYSNIVYDQNTEVIKLSEINVGDNTYEDCINGTIRKIDPRFDEGCDIYISDGGIYLASQYDKCLDALYPSMPIFFAVNRHLYDANTHINTQALDRVWKKLREQAQTFVQTLGARLRGDCFIVHIRGYETYRDAESEQNAVVDCNVRIPFAEIQYDTRYFRNVFLNRKPTARERIMSKCTRRVNYAKR